MKQIDRDILSIDLKSFYASVECLDRNMDPFTTPLVVADEDRGDGTIVLAASPFIKKKYGVKSRCRLYEVPKGIPGLIIAMPHMSRYLEISALINGIYLDYVSEPDLYIYSIDESFLDVTGYLKRHQDTATSYARKIIEDVRSRTGLTVTAGIGKNLFMAKAAMDIEAKHRSDFLAAWDYADIPAHLWPVSPLSAMWGIGSRLEKRLNDLGFFTIGDLACADVAYLKSKFGVIGEEIYYHAHGYDDARLQDVYVSDDHSLSVGQVLLRDYCPSEIPVVIRDMSYELSDRLYLNHALANTFLLFVGFKDHTGYGKKAMFFTPTDSGEKIGKRLAELFLEDCPEDQLFREIHLVACDIVPQDNYQGSLFEDPEGDRRVRTLETALREIRKRYGTAKAMPCSALTLSSTYLTRAGQIGGHHA
jgi:DNA polymerase V